MKVKSCKMVDIKMVTEADGRLLVMEEGSPVPFEIKRLFWVKDVTPGSSRGDHATKKTNLILFPLCGQCEVEVDDGVNRETIVMDDPTKGIYIENMIWRSMKNFTPDCIMMAVTDRKFEPGNETYDDYEEFLRALKDNRDVKM